MHSLRWLARPRGALTNRKQARRQAQTANLHPLTAPHLWAELWPLAHYTMPERAALHNPRVLQQAFATDWQRIERWPEMPLRTRRETKPEAIEQFA